LEKAREEIDIHR